MEKGVGALQQYRLRGLRGLPKQDSCRAQLTSGHWQRHKKNSPHHRIPDGIFLKVTYFSAPQPSSALLYVTNKMSVHGNKNFAKAGATEDQTTMFLGLFYA